MNVGPIQGPCRLSGVTFHEGEKLLLEVPDSKYSFTLRRINLNAMTAVVVEIETDYMLNSEGIFIRTGVD